LYKNKRVKTKNAITVVLLNVIYKPQVCKIKHPTKYLSPITLFSKRKLVIRIEIKILIGKVPKPEIPCTLLKYKSET